jgi:hypothetical protein
VNHRGQQKFDPKLPFWKSWRSLPLVFSSPMTALGHLVILGSLLIMGYVLLHLISPSSPATENAILQGFRRSETSTLVLVPDRNLLLMYFDEKRVDSVIAEVKVFLDSERTGTLDRRIDVLSSIANYVSYFNRAIPQVVISTAEPDLILSASGTLPIPPRLIDSLRTLDDLSQLTDDELKRIREMVSAINIKAVREWVIFAGCASGQSDPKPAICDHPDATLEDAKKDRFHFEISQLDSLQSTENEIWNETLEQAMNLRDDLSFSWIWIGEGLWIFELIFWSWIGVIINSMIAILETMRSKSDTGVDSYKAEHFVTIVPKFFMAPVMALMVSALVVLGVTEGNISLANAPMFLVFAFISGFASERFTAIVRAAVERLLPRLNVSQSKLENTQRWVETGSQSPVEEATNLSQLRTSMKDSIFGKASIELTTRMIANKGE